MKKYKLLTPLFCNYYNNLRILKRNLKLQFNFQFSSKENDDSNRELRLKKLLNAASPLKPRAESEMDWISGPYAKGTLFLEEELTEPDETKPDPEQTSIIMFPGQGNQFVGMAKNLIQYPGVKDMFSVASEILGYNLLKLCSEGPEKKLNETEYCQPAMLVCTLAALEKLKNERPWAIVNCKGVCGYSLGEMAALVFAGCLTFEKAIMLVKLRAEAMQACCQIVPSGMLSVLYGPGSDLSKALIEANEHCKTKEIKNSHCAIAGYLFPGCKIVAGHMEALNYLIKNGHKYRLRKLSQLPVSGAFHTNLMKDASVAFKNAIKNVEFKDPLIKVYSNVNGKPYQNNLDIKAKLPKQIYLPVKWEQTMQSIFERPKGTRFPFTYECGPGNSLSVVLKKINLQAAETCYSVQL